MLNPINAPKAKPVKIRIMSGGEEHSSLDSLRHHFDLADVEGLLDGRLVNWLNKIGEPDMAKKVSELQRPTEADDFTSFEKISCELIRIFFPTIKASKLTDIVNIWKETDEYKENAYYLYGALLHFYCFIFDDSIDIILLFYKEKPFETDWKEYFRREYYTCSNPDRLFRLGKELYEDMDTDEYKNIGIQMIEKAADLDYNAAIEYIEEAIPIDLIDAIIIRRKKNGFDEQTQKDIQEMISVWEECERANQPYSFGNRTEKFQGEKTRDIRELMAQVLICSCDTHHNHNRAYYLQQRLGQMWRKQGVFYTTSPSYKEKALILILAYLVGTNREINRTNIDIPIQNLALESSMLESYPLYQCIVEENAFSILTPNEIEILRSSQFLKEKILIIFEHIMDF